MLMTSERLNSKSCEKAINQIKLIFMYLLYSSEISRFN